MRTTPKQLRLSIKQKSKSYRRKDLQVAKISRPDGSGPVSISDEPALLTCGRFDGSVDFLLISVPICLNSEQSQLGMP